MIQRTLLALIRRHFPLSLRPIGRRWVCLGVGLLLIASARGGEPYDTPVPGDDATFRPTLVVRKGPALGTGIIIASVEGETLILTAAHVVDDPGPLHVELFRYNLGLERTRSTAGFPRRLPATIAALDHDTDLAILRVAGQVELPYVARIAPVERPIALGTAVTSIGFDRGERLSGFPTRVRRFDRVDMDWGGGDRPFLITENPPEVGRSGGGLFLADGALVGVCIARAKLSAGPVWGMYSTVGNIRRLLANHEDLTKVVNRSHPVAGSSGIKPTRSIKVPANHRTDDRARAN